MTETLWTVSSASRGIDTLTAPSHSRNVPPPGPMSYFLGHSEPRGTETELTKSNVVHGKAGYAA